MRAAVALLALASCTPPPVLTGQVLSAGNDNGQDEDPSLLRAAGGQLHVAWYSDRNGAGDKEQFIASSSDGQAWSEPLQLTRSDGDSFYPSLIQDTAGPLPPPLSRRLPLSRPGTDHNNLPT